MKQYLLLAVSLIPFAAIAAPTPVKIHFFEGLAPKDTTSSERFQKEYDSALETAKTLIAPRILKCGYHLETKTVFFGASDPLEALEGGKSSEGANAWMIVGPRRSNHFALLVKGSPNTPSVSTMASSQEIEALAPLHLSMAPTNKMMAKAAAKETNALLASRPKTYASIVSEDCLSCVDFAENFDLSAKALAMQKLADFRISGETPDLKSISEKISPLKPTAILVPNFSKVTAQVIAAIHKVYPDAIFVGGDGWGDSRFGFVQDAKNLDGTKGITVRGFPSADDGLKGFRLGQSVLKSKDAAISKPGSAAALSILKIVEGVSDLLCKEKPKSRDEFKSAFLKHGSTYFASPWGVSVYRMQDGDISYQRMLKGEK